MTQQIFLCYARLFPCLLVIFPRFYSSFYSYIHSLTCSTALDALPAASLTLVVARPLARLTDPYISPHTSVRWSLTAKPTNSLHWTKLPLTRSALWNASGILFCCIIYIHTQTWRFLCIPPIPAPVPAHVAHDVVTVPYLLLPS